MDEGAIAEQKEHQVRTTNGPKGIHPAIKKVWLFSGIIGMVFMGIIMVVPFVPFLVLLSSLGRNTTWIVVGLVAAGCLWLALFAFTLARIKMQWRNWTYEVREHDLVLTWGVFWRTRRHVARDRIQHLDINSGPLDRRFGLVQVGVHTAGAAGAVGVIPGLTPQEAEDLRDMILESQAEHV